MSIVLASVVLALQWCDPHGLYQQGWAGIGTELTRAFAPFDVSVRFAKEMDAEQEDRILVVLVRSEPEAWGLPPGAMGAVMSRSASERHVYLFFPAVARALGHRPDALRRRWPTPIEERALGRAFARVIAHEVIHALLPSRPHSEEGITGRTLDRSSLLASRIEIDPALARELRAALLRQLTVPSASSSNGRSR